jgi:hypothetical protein
MTKPKPQLVKISWRDTSHDWPWFYLLGTRGKFVHLKGADYPDGSVKHQGNSFWVHFSEIKEMVDA